MPENASLDDFFGGKADEDGHEATSEGDVTESVSNSAENGDTVADGEDVLATYDWSPTGLECESCGTTVQRRWRETHELVCEACKDW